MNLFPDNELKIKLYLYPVFFLTLGTIAFLNPGWEPFGVAMFVLAVIAGLHIILVSVIREGRYHIEADHNRIQEQKNLYEIVMKLDPEARYQLGLAPAPKEVKITVDKTKEVGNELSQVYRKIPLPPYKLKVIAQAVLNGEGFTIRKWVGTKEEPGLLTRTEWDAAHEAMEKLEMLAPVGDDPREGFMWTGLGLDVMTQIVKDSL